MSFTHEGWYAATSAGVLVSKDEGTIWKSAAKDDLLRQPTQSLEASNDGQKSGRFRRSTCSTPPMAARRGMRRNCRSLRPATCGCTSMDDTIYSSLRTWACMRPRMRDATGTARDSRPAIPGRGGLGQRARRFSAAQRLVASFDSGKSWKHVNTAFAEGYVPVVAYAATVRWLRLRLRKACCRTNRMRARRTAAMAAAWRLWRRPAARRSRRNNPHHSLLESALAKAGALLFCGDRVFGAGL